VISGQVKQAELDAYKTTLYNIPCKYFTRGQECPFGSSCLYQHGHVITQTPTISSMRLMQGADGRKKPFKESRLSDYLFRDRS